ncbi:hypothetical protein FACS189426_10310 [Bacteroidia bacterium]|nr:hypothetical protein FACS189426_10310 [Bacteroidia bacterium]
MLDGSEEYVVKKAFSLKFEKIPAGEYQIIEKPYPTRSDYNFHQVWVKSNEGTEYLLKLYLFDNKEKVIEYLQACDSLKKLKNMDNYPEYMEIKKQYNEIDSIYKNFKCTDNPYIAQKSSLEIEFQGLKSKEDSLASIVNNLVIQYRELGDELGKLDSKQWQINRDKKLAEATKVYGAEMAKRLIAHSFYIGMSEKALKEFDYSVTLVHEKGNVRIYKYLYDSVIRNRQWIYTYKYAVFENEKCTSLLDNYTIKY